MKVLLVLGLVCAALASPVPEDTEAAMRKRLSELSSSELWELHDILAEPQLAKRWGFPPIPLPPIPLPKIEVHVAIPNPVNIVADVAKGASGAIRNSGKIAAGLVEGGANAVADGLDAVGNLGGGALELAASMGGGLIDGVLNIPGFIAGTMLNIASGAVGVGLGAADFAAKVASGAFQVVADFGQLPPAALDVVAKAILEGGLNANVGLEIKAPAAAGDADASASASANANVNVANVNNVVIDIGGLVSKCRARPPRFYNYKQYKRGATATANANVRVTNINNVRIAGINKVCDALKQRSYY